MGNIQTVGPNEALIISGGCCRPSRKQIIVGGWCLNFWMLTNIQRISLQVMTLNPRCEHVQSTSGIPVNVSGVVHFKITSTREFLPLAAEQFLGKTAEQIKAVVGHTVEGHMRAVIGSQEIADICKERQTFASLIREAASADLTRMGIDILSLTIKDIKDDVEYLSSAGKQATANAKKDAAIAAAEAENSALEAEAKFESTKQELQAENEFALAKLRHQMEEAVASLESQLGKAKAESNRAYDLELARQHKEIKSKEMEVKEMELKNLLELQRLEGERRRIELEMEVELPTESQVYELTKQTESFKERSKCELQADEYRIKCEGDARAKAIQLQGLAEAYGLKALAEARREFNEAACLFEVVKVLPQVAAEIASPLNKFEEIVLISEGDGDGTARNSKDSPGSQTKGKFAAEAAKLTSSVPLAVKAVGGGDRVSGNILNSILQMQKSANLRKSAAT